MIFTLIALVVILFVLYFVFRVYRHFKPSRATFIKNWCIHTYGKDLGLETFKRALEYKRNR